MKRARAIQRLSPEFVTSVPDQVEDGKLYVSMKFATVIHNCVCGCGHEVVTPLSPIRWQLRFDGKSITLHPSIGNWSFDCESHYFIIRNEVRWAGKWSKAKIAENRRQYEQRREHADGLSTPQVSYANAGTLLKRRFRQLRRRLRRR